MIRTALALLASTVLCACSGKESHQAETTPPTGGHALGADGRQVSDLSVFGLPVWFQERI